MVRVKPLATVGGLVLGAYLFFWVFSVAILGINGWLLSNLPTYPELFEIPCPPHLRPGLYFPFISMVLAAVIPVLVLVLVLVLRPRHYDFAPHHFFTSSSFVVLILLVITVAALLAAGSSAIFAWVPQPKKGCAADVIMIWKDTGVLPANITSTKNITVEQFLNSMGFCEDMDSAYQLTRRFGTGYSVLTCVLLALFIAAGISVDSWDLNQGNSLARKPVPWIRYFVSHLRYGKWKQQLFRKGCSAVPPRRRWESLRASFDSNMEVTRNKAGGAIVTLPDLLRSASVFESIASSLHYEDVLNLMRTSKACYAGVISVAGSDDVIRKSTCLGAKNSQCWKCQSQLCEICTAKSSVPSPINALECLRSCEVLCSDCFRRNTCSIPGPRITCTCESTAPGSEVLRLTRSRPVCRNCAREEHASIIDKSAAPLSFKHMMLHWHQRGLTRTPCDFCGKDLGPIGEVTAARWWCCRTCLKMRTDAYRGGQGNWTVWSAVSSSFTTPWWNKSKRRRSYRKLDGVDRD